MNKAVLFTTLLVASTGAFAKNIPESLKHSEPGNFYFGGKAQHLIIEDAASGSDVNAQTIGGTLGVYLTHGEWGSLALDTFFSRTVNADTLASNTREVNVNIAGGHLAYRTPTKIYGKAKAGMVSTELDNVTSDDEDDLQFSWGLGGGIEVYYGVDLELEYSELRDGISAWGLALIFND